MSWRFDITLVKVVHGIARKFECVNSSSERNPIQHLCRPEITIFERKKWMRPASIFSFLLIFWPQLKHDFAQVIFFYIYKPFLLAQNPN